MLYIIIVPAALAAICLYLVLAPFFKASTGAGEAHFKNPSMEMVYEAVNEHEMDMLMGKISPEDFISIKETYYRAAAAALHQKNDVDREILEALAAIRTQGSHQ